MKVRLAFEQKAHPDIKSTVFWEYLGIQGVDVPEPLRSLLAQQDYQKQFVVNPGYVSNLEQLRRCVGTWGAPIVQQTIDRLQRQVVEDQRQRERKLKDVEI